MDVLFLTCHFMFEQKQLSLQTPCSTGLWVLLTGTDLFTQPLDKMPLPAHPGATPTITAPPVPPPSLHYSLPTPRSWWYLLAEANAPQYSHSEWSPLALGDCSGLIRSFMMKWAERPQLHPAPASNHSSLNWWGSSHSPTGFKSWITFLFRSLSNYLHPS